MDYSSRNSAFNYSGGPSATEPLYQSFHGNTEPNWPQHETTPGPVYYRQYASHDSIDVSIQVSNVRTQAHVPTSEHSSFLPEDIGTSQFMNGSSTPRVPARHRAPTDQLADVRQLPFTEHQHVLPAPFQHYDPQVTMQQQPQQLAHYTGVLQYSRRPIALSPSLPTVACPPGAVTFQGTYDSRPATSSLSSSLVHGWSPSVHVSQRTVHADHDSAATLSPSNHLTPSIGPSALIRRSTIEQHPYTEFESQYSHPSIATAASVQLNTLPAPDVASQHVASTPAQLDVPGHELRYQFDHHTSHYVPSVTQLSATESRAAPTPPGAAGSSIVHISPEGLPSPLAPPIVDGAPVFSVGAADPAKKGRTVHPCPLCHKSFDRPSTLRIVSRSASPICQRRTDRCSSQQHRRVHTLEKSTTIFRRSCMS